MTTQERNLNLPTTNPLIEVLAIYICGTKGEPMQLVEEVEALAGVGLVGDRYAAKTGAFSGSKRLADEDRQVTFISRSGIDEANAILIAQGHEPYQENETRRNIVISISPEEVEALVDQEFVIQGMLFRGVEVCDPCDRPRKLRNKTGNFQVAFQGKGGLRARVLSSGKLRVRQSE